VIASVVEGSEAERAGLAPGDVLVAVNGVPVGSMADARQKLSGPLADDVVANVRRGATELALRIRREEVRR
jgi:S1-C subfamily serine protease